MIAGARAWTLQHLELFLKLKFPFSRPSTFILPREIVLMVVSYLDSPSTTCLALTCRGLYSLCFPNDPCLNPAERETLLLLLEKDTATHYFCHYCTKLHGWNPSLKSGLLVYPEKGRTSLCKRPPDDMVYLPALYYLPYYYARLIMNRHFHGPRHGPAVRELEHRVYSCQYADGVVKAWAQRARIVEGQLLVRAVISLRHYRGDAGALMSRIHDRGPRVCTHLSLAKGYGEWMPFQLPELGSSSSSSMLGSSLFSFCGTVSNSCAFCLTDYDFSVLWRGEKKGYTVEIVTYRQLGDCRSFFDWSWRSMSDVYTEKSERVERPLQYTPGCVRSLWSQGDGNTAIN